MIKVCIFNKGNDERKMCVICIEVVIQEMGWYESAKKRGIQDEYKGPRTEPWGYAHFQEQDQDQYLST